MNTTKAIAPDRARAGHRPTVKAARLFYPLTCLLLLALAIIGFGRFFAHGQAYPGREIAPSIKTVVIAHGLSMTLWMFILTAQPALIYWRKHRVHMALGKLGALLAVAILVLGVLVAIRSAQAAPPDAIIWGFTPKQFMAVPFISVVLFTIFIALGVYFRRKPALHRNMMLVGTLVTMSAAISRIDTLNNLYLGGVWEKWFGPFFMTLLLSILLLLIRCALTRSLDKILAVGVALLIASSVFIMQIAPTPAWEAFASLFVK